MADEVTQQHTTAARCGFSRCRQPLPPPGPRGARPYEFCPDRTWDGGKTCKQLAAAEQALHDALGETTDAAAMAGATATFREHAEHLVPRLGELASAVQAVQARLESELADALARADQAEVQAREDRDLRTAAEHERDEAAEQRRCALDEAEQQRADRDAAEEDRAQALARAREAELARARAETGARAERERAEAAERRAEKDRGHVETAEASLAEVREQQARVTAQHDAARSALAEARESLAEARESLRRVEDSAEERVQRAHAEARTDRDRLAAAYTSLREQESTHHERLGELREQLGGLRARAAAQATDLTAAHDRLDGVRTAIAGDHDARLLRRRVRAALDGDDPESVPAEEDPPPPAETAGDGVQGA